MLLYDKSFHQKSFKNNNNTVFYNDTLSKSLINTSYVFIIILAIYLLLLFNV